MERKTLTIAIGLVGVAVMGVGMAILFAGGPPPAPPRPRLPPVAAPEGSEMKYSATLFRATIEQDAKALGVAAPPPGVLAAVFPYFDELPAKRSLRAGASLRTAHLRLSVIVRREQGAVEGQAFRADHLVLKVENLTRGHLAYRITTQVPDATRCEAKGVIAHNAVALAPGETIMRTECLFQRAAGIDVARVEVIEVPALSYWYLSRLPPGLVLYDLRTSEGHDLPRAGVCPQTFSWREVRDGAERGQLDWRDIIDFYARHNCDEYAFFPGYRYRTEAGGPLPARPPAAPP